MSDTREFSCVTSGDELLAIGQALRTAVGQHLVGRERTPDGLHLQVARRPGAAAALRDYARREQACCSFFDITVTEDAETLSVTLTGPPEAAALVDLLYQLAEPASTSSTGETSTPTASPSSAGCASSSPMPGPS